MSCEDSGARSDGPVTPDAARASGEAAAQPGDSPEVARARAELAQLRSSIDNIDAALIHILAERFRFTQAVGRLKACHDFPPADPVREAQQVSRLRALATASHLDPAFAEKFLAFIVAEVIHHHERLAAEAGRSDA